MPKLTPVKTLPKRAVNKVKNFNIFRSIKNIASNNL